VATLPKGRLPLWDKLLRLYPNFTPIWVWQTKRLQWKRSRCVGARMGTWPSSSCHILPARCRSPDVGLSGTAQYSTANINKMNFGLILSQFLYLDAKLLAQVNTWDTSLTHFKKALLTNLTLSIFNQCIMYNFKHKCLQHKYVIIKYNCFASIKI
jgi:hypothetical protein